MTSDPCILPSAGCPHADPGPVEKAAILDGRFADLEVFWDDSLSTSANLELIAWWLREAARDER